MGVRARDLRHAAIGACANGGDARMGVGQPTCEGALV